MGYSTRGTRDEYIYGGNRHSALQISMAFPDFRVEDGRLRWISERMFVPDGWLVSRDATGQIKIASPYRAGVSY